MALKDIKQQVSLAIAKMESLHLGRVTGRLSENDVTPGARTVCGNSNMWYDSSNVKCDTCDSNMYDRRSGQCLVSPYNVWHQENFFKLDTFCGAGATWRNSVLGAHKMRVYAPADNTRFWMHYKTLTYQYGYNGCYGDRESLMIVWPVVDGTRQGAYCQQQDNRGWGTNDNEYSLLECSFVMSFSKGEHYIDFDVQGRGNENYLHGYPYSSTRVQQIGTVARQLAAEKKAECRGRTSR